MRNVADLADAPTNSRASRTMSAWTSDELRAFLEAISDHYLHPLYLLAATTGMRRAEIAGLAWRNVDLDTARLTVNRQLLSVEYKLIESDLKTPTSRRTIDLDPHTVTQTAPPPAPPARRSHGHRPPPHRTATSSPNPTDPPSTPTSSARPSNASSPNSTYPASVYTTCATPMPPFCCNKALTPKSSANASATPASHSPWTSTNTSYPACKPKPQPPSEPPSSAKADDQLDHSPASLVERTSRRGLSPQAHARIASATPCLIMMDGADSDSQFARMFSIRVDIVDLEPVDRMTIERNDRYQT